MDDRIAVWAATHRAAALNDAFVALGDIERFGAVWVALAVVVALARRFSLERVILLAVFTALVTVAADGVSFGVKDLVNRPRPFESHPRIHPLYVVHSSSFPAGHAATAFAGATLLAYFAPRAAPLFVLLAAAIASSRVYVGVHYPTDVLAGAAIGVAVGAAAIAAVKLAQAHAAPLRLRAAAGG